MILRVFFKYNAWLAGISLLLGFVFSVHAQGNLILQNANLIIGDGSVLINHDLRVEDGLIVDLGQNLPFTEAAQVVAVLHASVVAVTVMTR